MTIKVPGKLMIAGEFSVLEPYQKLAVMAVDRFVYATIQKTPSNTLVLKDFNIDTSWEFNGSSVVVESDNPRINFVQEAMTTTLTYLKEHDIEISPFSLTVKSELDDESGKKYGLGSSAAVVTSIVASMLNYFLPIKPADMLIFKLAAISHVKTQGNGSGADIAAATYGGVLEYSSFQAEWLLEEIKNDKSLTDLVEKKWTYLKINPITIPKELELCIGWTGNPASTSNLVNKVLKLKENDPSKFKTFIHHSERAVQDFLKGMETNDIPLLFKGIKTNRQALAKVGQRANVRLETPLLKTLSDLAERYGGVGKQSGAGGGDCGIAFMPSKEKNEQLKQAWLDAGIKPMALAVCPDGATIIDE